MSYFRLLLPALILTLSISASFGQNKKLDKTLKKVDGYYYSGNFPKAFSALKKFKGGVDKLGSPGNYMVDFHVREARLNLSSGSLPAFEKAVENALALAEKTYGISSKSYVTTLLDVAELHNEYGNYRATINLTEKAKDILTKSSLMDDAYNARLVLISAEALTGQGFCNQAIERLRSVEEYLARRAVDKETTVENGAIKSKRVPEEELPVRFESYAKLLSLIGNAYGEKGELKSADSAFVAARTWIRKNRGFLGENSLVYVRNNFMHAKMLMDNGAERTAENVLEFDNILNDLKSQAAPTHSLGHDVYLAYLQQLIDKDQNARYITIKSEYERKLSKYFPKSSIVHANLNAVEFTKKLARDKTRTIEKDALAMLNSRSVPKNYKTTVTILEFLTEVALTEKLYNNAETYRTQICDIKKELCGENSPEYHLAKLELASFYMDYTSKLDQAGKIFEESYVNFLSKEIGAWHKDHLTILNHLAKYYELTDKYTLAAATLDKASDVAWSKYRNTDALYGVALDHIAELSIKIGEYDKAQEKIKTALKILEEYRKDDRYVGARIHALETEAKLYGIQGLFDEAEDNLKETADMLDDAEGILGTDVSGSEELTALYIQLGRYSDADEILETQIPEYEKLYGPESLKLIQPLVNRGRLYLAKGDYTEAERIALRANRIAAKIYGENSTKSAPTQKLLADIYYTLGDYDKAELNCQKAILSQEKQFSRMHVEVAKSLAQVALVKFYKGDNRQTVEQLLIEARDIMAAKLGKANPQYAEILKNVAVLYISEKRFDIAFNSLTVAEGIWRTKAGRKNNINAAGIYTLTGDVYYQLKNYAKAEDFYNKAIDVYENVFKSTKHPEYVKVRSKLSKVAYMKGEYKRSKKLIEESLGNYENFIKLYFPALSEREKAKYWNTIKGDFEFYNTLAFSNLEDFRDLTGKIYNYQLLTKALLLSSSIKIRERIMNSTDEQLKNQYSEWIDKKEQLTLALSMNDAQLAEAGINPDALQQEVERLEKDLSQKSEIFGQAFETKKITYDEVKKVLKPNEVAMEMVRYRYFNHTFTDSVIYAALYVTKETSRPKAIILPDGKKMEGRNFKFYRNAITTKLSDHHSYDAYWKTINDALGVVSTIYFSADGVYNQINLESILAPDGRYIIDNSNIVLVSNTKDIYQRAVKSSDKFKENTATMFGNPAFYLASAEDTQTISPLPGTEREVNQLQFMLKEKGWATAEYVAENATEEKIKELNSPKIFHIATHGLYRPTTQATDAGTEEAVALQNPLLRTGLLLKGAGDLLKKTSVHYNMENGILTAYEAMSLSLDKTDLVVLSACETGLGDLEAGEGVYGLQRAFLVAGAKVLIMSMFKVDDEATQKLMLKFYQKWLNSGNMRLSFIEAKKELRMEYPEPIYWGAFMMIGLE